MSLVIAAKNKTYTFDVSKNPVIKIGTYPESDIVIKSGSPSHAIIETSYIHPSSGVKMVEISDCGTPNRTFIWNPYYKTWESIVKAELVKGAVFQIGFEQFTIIEMPKSTSKLPSAPNDPKANPMQLTISSVNGSKTFDTETKPIIKIGTDPRSHVVTQSGSRMHAVIEVGGSHTNPSGVRLIDLAGAGGTQIFSNAVWCGVKNTPLFEGSVFKIGDEEFRVTGIPSQEHPGPVYNETSKPKTPSPENKTVSSSDIKEMLEGVQKGLTKDQLLFLDVFAKNFPLELFMKATAQTIQELRGKVSPEFELQVSRSIIDFESALQDLKKD